MPLDGTVGGCNKHVQRGTRKWRVFDGLGEDLHFVPTPTNSPPQRETISSYRDKIRHAHLKL